MKEIILIKNGELTLKGLNRCNFEDILIRNIRKSIRDLGECNIKKAQSTIFIEPRDDSFDFPEALERIKRVFGIAAFSRACVCEKDMADIIAKSPDYLREDLKKVKTFKVEAKRSDKRFPLTSPEICREIGGVLLSHFPHLSVDVHNPDIIITVEVRDYGAYIHSNAVNGAGGMPYGTNGKATLLLSGGIDSPVAGYRMMRRGMKVECCYFHAYPYTSDEARKKVEDLAQIISHYGLETHINIIPFTDVQMKIKKLASEMPDAPDGLKTESYSTLLLRMCMMKTANLLAKRLHCQCIITGESLGQVASQTVENMEVTESCCDFPLLRATV